MTSPSSSVEILLFGGLRMYAPSGTLVVEARPDLTAADIKRAVAAELASQGGDAVAWVESSRLATESRVLGDDEAVVLRPGTALALLPPVNGG